jgi:hypothetical protein
VPQTKIWEDRTKQLGGSRTGSACSKHFAMVRQSGTLQNAFEQALHVSRVHMFRSVFPNLHLKRCKH